MFREVGCLGGCFFVIIFFLQDRPRMGNLFCGSGVLFPSKSNSKMFLKNRSRAPKGDQMIFIFEPLNFAGPLAVSFREGIISWEMDLLV